MEIVNYIASKIKNNQNNWKRFETLKEVQQSVILNLKAKRDSIALEAVCAFHDLDNNKFYVDQREIRKSKVNTSRSEIQIT